MKFGTFLYSEEGVQRTVEGQFLTFRPFEEEPLGRFWRVYPTGRLLFMGYVYRKGRRWVFLQKPYVTGESEPLCAGMVREISFFLDALMGPWAVQDVTKGEKLHGRKEHVGDQEIT